MGICAGAAIGVKSIGVGALEACPGDYGVGAARSKLFSRMERPTQSWRRLGASWVASTIKYDLKTCVFDSDFRSVHRI